MISGIGAIFLREEGFVVGVLFVGVLELDELTAVPVKHLVFLIIGLVVALGFSTSVLLLAAVETLVFPVEDLVVALGF